VDNWVSCRRRAPDYDGNPFDVLVTYKDGTVGTAGYIGGGQYMSYHYKDGRFERVVVTDDVTHWMHMPKPPGKGKAR